MPDLTAKLARHIVGYRNADLDRAALTVAKQCILDWHGVTLAGANEPVARILREEIATPGKDRRRSWASISAARRPMPPWSTAQPPMRSTMTTFIR